MIYLSQDMFDDGTRQAFNAKGDRVGYLGPGYARNLQGEIIEASEEICRAWLSKQKPLTEDKPKETFNPNQTSLF